MENNTWTRKEYTTWEEAFRALAPAMRQESVRVAEYTQVLYQKACEAGFGAQESAAYPERIRSKYAEVAYKCGLYHQIGKALVPQEYQILQRDFTEEEIAVYRKYTTDGRALAARLQELSLGAKQRRRTESAQEAPTENIPFLMIRESCAQHMERYDGSGYPAGLAGAEISPIAQIVGLAKELDRLSATVKAEEPFADAYEALTAQAGKSFSPALIEILKGARAKCRAIYNKYILYTLTVPKTVPLVEKRKDRPMGLRYFPVRDSAGKAAYYRARPYFGGLPDAAGETESAAQIAPLLARAELTKEVTFYLCYEAADALLRAEHCAVPFKGILLETIPGFFTAQNETEQFAQLFADQPVPKEKLILTINAKFVETATKGVLAALARYRKNGISLLLDAWNPVSLPTERLKELGFAMARIDASAPQRSAAASSEEGAQAAAAQNNAAAEETVPEALSPLFLAAYAAAAAQGVLLFAGGVDSEAAAQALRENGVAYLDGPIFGHEQNEDAMIRELLAQAQGAV